MKRVFVIDDDSEMRALLHDVLMKHGFHVDTFASAREALNQLKALSLAPVGPNGVARGIDAVICDVIMPDMDGREFLKKFKVLFPRVPVILITAFGSALSPKEAFVAGANQLLMKPFGISELLDALKSA